MNELNHPFDRPEFKLQKKRPKKSLIIFIAIVLLAIAGGATYFYLQVKGNNANQQPVSGSNEMVKEALSVSREIAEIAQTQGGEAAQKKIDEKIEQAETKKEQADLYTLKLSTLLSSNDPNTAVALQYAYKAEEIYPTFGSALNIADLEYAAKNNTVALKYYELYMERSIGSDGESLDPTGKTFYERRIQELKV
jgi:flagellar basal body-associated protein FliL